MFFQGPIYVFGIEDTKGDAKCTKWSGLGYSTSLEIASFDRVHMSSYLAFHSNFVLIFLRIYEQKSCVVVFLTHSAYIIN